MPKPTGPAFTSGVEVRRHRFAPPPNQTFKTFVLRVKKVGWMETAGAVSASADGVAAAAKGVELHGWVQVRDVKFYVTRLHALDASGTHLD